MICSKCGNQFNSPFCPNCGTPAQSSSQFNTPQQLPPHIVNQQPYYTKFRQPPLPQKRKTYGCLIAFLIVIGIFIFITFIGIMGVILESGDSKDLNTRNRNTVKQEVSKPTEKPIEYTSYDVSEMLDDLNTNAMKAEKKYTDQYVEITGRLSNIDSDGDYIDLAPSNDEFTIIGVQCYIKSDDQTNKVMELSKGDIVTVKGKITRVGEIMGYALDIEEIK